jgi:hypothetical protein
LTRVNARRTPASLRRARVRHARAAVLLLLAASGCVDPQGRYDDFLQRTEAMRGQDAGMIGAEERFDFSGSYLLALSTTLAPGQPLLFSCEVTVAADLETLALSVRPLTTEDDAEPRTPTGERFEASAVAYGEDGSFSADFGEVTVPSDANPISGADIVATVAITATAFPMSDELPDFFCGQATGMVSAPLALDLEGSTVGAVAAEPIRFGDVEPLVRCPRE